MLISLDTETELITPDNQIPRIVCAQIADDRNVTLLHWSECERWITGVITDPSITIVGHSIAFDMWCIAKMFPYLLPVIFEAYESNRVVCTEALAKLKDIELGNYRGFWRGRKINYDLESVGERFTNHRINKKNPWRLRFGELRDYPVNTWPVDARQYALDDARVTYDVAVALMPWPEDTFRQARAAFWLKDASNTGLLTDDRAVDAWEAELTEQRNELGAVLVANGLARVTKTGKYKGKITRNEKETRARVREVWPSDKEIPLTGSGEPSLKGENLKESGDWLLETYADYSAVNKKISTDVKLLRADGKRIHTHFDSLKDTGRTGSKEPNIQNFDRKSGIRECFIPEDGKVFIAADYGKGELCTWSQCCLWMFGHSDMARVLNAGGDPHMQIAARLAGCSYEDALANKNSEYIDDRRQVGKVVDFGCPGGMGIDRLVDYAKNQYHVILTPEQAKDARQVWRDSWWEARAYHKYISSLFDQYGDSIAITHPVSNRIRGGPRYTQACNSFFQGLLADAGKDAGFYICKASYIDYSSPLYGCRVVNFPHDEFIAEAPLGDQSHFAALELSNIMMTRAALWIPDVPPIAEPLLMSRWSKKAKPRFDARKMLVPWTP